MHKANAVPNTGGLWRSVFRKELEKRPSLVGAEAYADSFCYNLIRDPTQFDIVLAPNLLGDIISDVGAALAGGLAMAPSSSICPETGFGLFEPVHGSAPDIAGSGKANPGGMALSLAMLFNHVDRSDVGALLTECVREAAASPTATPDVGGNGTTRTFVESILFRIRQKTS